PDGWPLTVAEWVRALAHALETLGDARDPRREQLRLGRGDAALTLQLSGGEVRPEHLARGRHGGEQASHHDGGARRPPLSGGLDHRHRLLSPWSARTTSARVLLSAVKLDGPHLH